MQKISDSTNTANPAGEFTEGNPAAGAPATLLKATWLNAIQRELVGLVLGAGISLNANDDEQVLKAVKALAGTAADFKKLTNKPTTLLGYGITDAFTKPETTSAIQQAVAALVASSPAALDTLKELATALGNDPNFATTMTNALAGKASKATTLGGYGIADAFTKTETATAIQQAVAALVASSPAALDTLKELADALGNDPNFATTITNSLAGKVAGDWADTVGFASNDFERPYVRRKSDQALCLLQPALGFSPVRQGGGVGQAANTVKVGWSSVGLKATVDATDLGTFWMSTNFDPSSYVKKSELPLGFGVSQGWQNVTSSRSATVTYSNATARTIALNITTNLSQNGSLSIAVNGEVQFSQTVNNATSGAVITGIALVPPGATYQVTVSYFTIAKWTEFR